MTDRDFTRTEALNVAWHVRVNGHADVSQENIRKAFAALEREATKLSRVEALPTEWRGRGFVNLVDRNATVECAQDLENALKGS